MKYELKKRLITALPVLFLGIHLSHSQCLIVPLQGTAYEVYSCGPYTLQSLTGNLAPVFGSCGNLIFTSPLTGSDISTATNTPERATGVEIYPNPTENSITIQLHNTSKALAELYSAMGHRLCVQQLTADYTQWDLQAYPAGYYFLRITSEENVVFIYQLIKN